MQTRLSAFPNGVPVPVNFPHRGVLALWGKNQQISILKQPGELGLISHLPPVHLPPLIINQVNRLAAAFTK